jgi:hypothetical protein
VIQAVDVGRRDTRRVAVEKKTKRYPSDLTDDERVALEFSLRQPARRSAQSDD